MEINLQKDSAKNALKTLKIRHEILIDFFSEELEGIAFFETRLKTKKYINSMIDKVILNVIKKDLKIKI
jgi:hypothetical protein